MKLADAYLSVHESLKHAGIHHGVNVRVRWVDAEGMSVEEAAAELERSHGVLVPGGFGSRGWEGKIVACQVARERGIPYLGICLGMHVAVSEFARNVVGMHGANSTEMDPETPFPVIDLLPEQKEVEDLGGTMRLGAQPVDVVEGSRVHAAYGETVIYERHRHRYEVNNHYRQQIADAGLVISRHVPGGTARRDRRAARPPVVRREPVPPGVQVAAHEARAALPRLRGRRRRARAHARRRARVLRLASLEAKLDVRAGEDERVAVDLVRVRVAERGEVGLSPPFPARLRRPSSSRRLVPRLCRR